MRTRWTRMRTRGMRVETRGINITLESQLSEDGEETILIVIHIFASKTPSKHPEQDARLQYKARATTH